MKVKFVPQKVEFEIKPGESVLHVAQDHGIYIKSVCKGVPSCAECRCRVVEGQHNVLPPASEELSLIGSGHFIDHRRLTCQLKCFGDITVDLTEQVEKQRDGGKKSKGLLAKSDRVEDETAIRTSSGSEGEDGGSDEVMGAEGAEPDAPPRQPAPRAPRPPGQQRQGDSRAQAQSRQGGPGGQGGQAGQGASSGEGKGDGARKRRRRRRGGGGRDGEGGPKPGSSGQNGRPDKPKN